tara:strand:- start:215 stop:436 length:222 start_codon:yes stop_codon:yes gene_type:complete
MDIFGGRKLKDLVYFYDRKGDKTMVKKIYDLIDEISADIEKEYVEIDSEGDDCDLVEETYEVKISDDGFHSLV